MQTLQRIITPCSGSSGSQVLDPEYKDAAVLGKSLTTKTDFTIFIL
jgi:hypothetical protein